MLSARSPGTIPGAPDFIAVQLAAASAALVVLNERLRVVRPGFDPATLRAVVQALSTDVPA